MTELEIKIVGSQRSNLETSSLRDSDYSDRTEYVIAFQNGKRLCRFNLIAEVFKRPKDA